MNVKFSPNLFLEVVELEKFKQSLDIEGFRKNLLQNSERFGLVKNQFVDSGFSNGHVTEDLDNVLGNKTVQVEELHGIDKFGNYLFQEKKRQIPIPDDGNWYWIRVKHQYSSQEKGTFSISANGDLVGDVNAELTKIFRGQPNFPTRIKFINSTGNTLEYDVLEVIDDQHAIIQHPALNTSGLSAFTPETGLTFKIVGTFTPGIAVPNGDKFIFEYDSCFLDLVQENTLTNNVRPAYIQDVEFFIARVKVVTGELVIQDKRIEYWETKGSRRCLDIERNYNPLIGVENIKWNHLNTAADRNIVEIAWGMRSQNWTVESSKNVVTFYGGSLGGKYKSPDDFINGDFDGWRIYTENGRYSKIISSIKQGSSINLTLDVLDVDNYSSDGGLNFDSTIGKYLLVVPDCEEIELKFIPNQPVNQPFMEKVFTFPVNTLLSKSELPLFELNTCKYNVQYRYKSYKDYSEFKIIPSDEVVGYYAERSFVVETGNLKPVIGDRVQKTYESILDEGFIELEVAPHSLALFKNKVDKGDIIGCTTYTALTATLYEITVGVSTNYQYIKGNIVLPGDDVYFNIKKLNNVKGNEFRFHFEADSIDLTGKTIIISYEGLTPGSTIPIKIIRQADVWMMKNQDGGIVFDCVFEGGEWLCYQNYNLGSPGQVKTLDGVIADLFDTTGWGKVMGLFGYHLMNGQDGVADLRDRFIVGAGNGYVVGATGGANTVALTVPQLPDHSHRIPGGDGGVGSGYVGFPDNGDSNPAHNKTQGLYTAGGGTQVTGGDAHENRPPYYALIYAKQMF